MPTCPAGCWPRCASSRPSRGVIQATARGGKMVLAPYTLPSRSPDGPRLLRRERAARPGHGAGPAHRGRDPPAGRHPGAGREPPVPHPAGSGRGRTPAVHGAGSGGLDARPAAAVPRRLAVRRSAWRCSGSSATNAAKRPPSAAGGASRVGRPGLSVPPGSRTLARTSVPSPKRSLTGSRSRSAGARRRANRPSWSPGSPNPEAETPSSRTRRGPCTPWNSAQTTANRQSPASVGSRHRARARERAERLVAVLERDRARAQPVVAQAPRHRVAQLQQRAAQPLAVGGVRVEGVLVADALGARPPSPRPARSSSPRASAQQVVAVRAQPALEPRRVAARPGRRWCARRACAAPPPSSGPRPTAGARAAAPGTRPPCPAAPPPGRRACACRRRSWPPASRPRRRPRR